MPLVKIECRGPVSPAVKKTLLDGVHDALVTAFKIPDSDRHQRFVTYAPEDFEIPAGKGERFTVVELAVFPGRSLDAKRSLYREIVSRFVAAGIPATDVFILLHEVPLDNWGLRGGIPGSEIKLGFKLDV